MGIHVHLAWPVSLQGHICVSQEIPCIAQPKQARLVGPQQIIADFKIKISLLLKIQSAAGYKITREP